MPVHNARHPIRNHFKWSTRKYTRAWTYNTLEVRRKEQEQDRSRRQGAGQEQDAGAGRRSRTQEQEAGAGAAGRTQEQEAGRRRQDAGAGGRAPGPCLLLLPPASLKWGSARESGVNIVPPLNLVTVTNLPAKEYDTSVA